MSNGEIIIPPGDLTTAAIDAVNIILSQLGISPLDIILGLFSGKPQFEDTNNVIWAYNMSAYWPLHALASDLQIAEKNGAPISDSNPAIQQQFGVWKQGTVTSIQTFAGVQAGPSGPGYWTIFDLIEKSWKASGTDRLAVLQYVKALDALTQVLSQQKPTTPPPPPPPPPIWNPPPGGGGGGGQTDDLCFYLEQIANDLQVIMAELAKCKPADNTACCTAIVAAIGAVATAITALGGAPGGTVSLTPVADALAAIDGTLGQYQPILVKLADCVCALSGLPSTPGVDLKPVVDALNSIAADLARSPSDVAMQIKRLADANDKADALAVAAIGHWASMIVTDPAILQVVTS